MNECIEILQDILNHIDSHSGDKFFREIREIKLSKDEVIGKFQPIFSPVNIDRLNAESYRAFLQFDNNKHWTGLYRKGNSASANMKILKENLKVLVSEELLLSERFDKANKVYGLGKAIITAILQVVFPDKYGIWNNRVEKGMKNSNLWPIFPRGLSDGEKYEILNRELLQLAEKLKIDLWTLDSLWWFIDVKGIKLIDKGELSEEEMGFPEGRALFRTHKFYERNSNLVQKKKQEAQNKGQLKCCICGFDFHEVYGEVGKGFIECHHSVPVSEYSLNTATKLADLVLVCSNCHRILHRQRPCLSIEQMKGNISINKNKIRVNLC
jgi:hypothetical protein